MSKKTYKEWGFSLLFLLVLILGSILFSQEDTISTTQELETTTEFLSSGPTSSPTLETATVIRVIDGDTIELSTGEKVRYIGIDTPETVQPNTPVECMGKEASQKNTELVLGKKIQMEKDVSETDRYNRLLRYVYVNGIFVNNYLVEEGYALASSYPPDIRYQEKFSQSQQKAQTAQKGLWSDICSIPSAASQASSVSDQLTQTQENFCQYSCSGPDRDCKDFKNHTEALTFFTCCGFTATNDPMNLDDVKIGDGNPCENNH